MNKGLKALHVVVGSTVQRMQGLHGSLGKPISTAGSEVRERLRHEPTSRTCSSWQVNARTMVGTQFDEMIALGMDHTKTDLRVARAFRAAF